MAFRAIIWFAALLLATGSARAAEMRVTLLGTGTPILSAERFGMSTLVQAGGKTLLFDSGRGAAIRLHQAKVALGEIDAIFITHLHSDHIAGLPDIYATAPLVPPGRTRSFEIWGPSGIDDVGRGLELLFQANNRIRARERAGSATSSIVAIAPVTRVTTRDVPTSGGVVFQDGGVTVTAFQVEHGTAKPAYGYRVDYGGRAVVLSGDTGYAPNLVRYARGVDLLVQCVAIGSRRLEQAAPEVVGPRYAHLATPEVAARILSETRPKQAVLSHISLLSRPDIPRATNQELNDRIRALYDGTLVIGEDLMSFSIKDGGVVQQTSPATREAPERE